MEKPRNLEDFSSKEMQEFLDSFDTIITDCDGVLWLGNTPIKGSLETLKKLQSLGKRIFFVSNNSTQAVEELCEKCRSLGYAASPHQIAIPSSVICWYLKRLDFKGKAFVLGTKKFRQVLKDGGIDVGEAAPEILEERIDALLAFFRNAPEVDAVIVDFDLNINWAKITRSIRYLKNSEKLFLTGGIDRVIPISERISFLGNADFVKMISRESNRKPIECAKPSEAMKNYVMEKFGIDNPARCIFIGDSLDSDMKFADLCGFGKLWVGSGIHTLEEFTSRQHSTIQSNSSLPYYYLPSLSALTPLLHKSHSIDGSC